MWKALLFSEEQTEDQRDLETYWKSHSKHQTQYSNKDILDSKVCSLLTVLSYRCVCGSVFWGVLEILKLGTWVPEAPGWEEHWQKWVIKDSINPGWTNKKWDRERWGGNTINLFSYFPGPWELERDGVLCNHFEAWHW